MRKIISIITILFICLLVMNVSAQELDGDTDLCICCECNQEANEVIFVETDADTGEGVEDTVINIYDNNNQVVDSIMTDQEGIASTQLSNGDYYYQEYKSNNDYKVDDQIYSFKVSSSNKTINRKLSKKIDLYNSLDDNLLTINNVPNTSKYDYSVFVLILVGVLIVIKEIL